MAFSIHFLFVFVALCVLSLHNANAFRNFKWPKEPQLAAFSWQNCGPATDPIQVKTLDIKPDPLMLPGNATLSTTFSLAKAGPTDVSVAITMEKKVAGFYIKVPCVDNVGSCTYDNMCQDWAAACPKYFEKFGIPCTCPIPANSYSIPDVEGNINIKLPAGANGPFRITANMNSASAGHLGCIQLLMNLQ